jgi:hypothetical protein
VLHEKKGRDSMNVPFPLVITNMSTLKIPTTNTELQHHWKNLFVPEAKFSSVFLFFVFCTTEV